MLLTVDDLRISIATPAGRADAVAGASLTVQHGRTTALLGESGCGKSLTALALLRLLPPAARIEGGRINFDGLELTSMPEARLRALRGDRLAMIFQEPMSSLNPLMTVGAQVAEALERRRLTRAEGRRQAVELLRRVGIADAPRRADQYPHELSGGMRQRVMIAMATACEPELLIADEPTTALDVTVQAQILDLLGERQRAGGMAILLITHDLGLVRAFAHDAFVMYAGRIVEFGPAAALLDAPRHPYTQALRRSVPRLTIGGAAGSDVGEHGPLARALSVSHGRDADTPSQSSAASDPRPRLFVIPGEPPSPGHHPSGCPFHPRCALGRDEARCRTHDPPMVRSGDGYAGVACWKADMAATRLAIESFS